VAPPQLDAENSDEVLPPWVAVTPTRGMLTPGQEMEVTFKIGVADPMAAWSGSAPAADPATAERVVRRADAPNSLAHMLVLRVVGGADHFVVVEGTYRPSFFGLTISTLEEQEVSATPAELDACECSGNGMSAIFASPFTPSQWAVIPQPLKKMLHFLARCAPVAAGPPVAALRPHARPRPTVCAPAGTNALPLRASSRRASR
jgi:hypothetical protein